MNRAFDIGAHQPNTLRLTLVTDRNEMLVATMRRVSLAALELAAVLTVGWLLSAVTKAEFWSGLLDREFDVQVAGDP